MKSFLQVLILLLLLIAGVALYESQRPVRIVLQPSESNVIHAGIFDSVPPVSDPDTINVIVEIPKGSMNKYEIDKKTGLIKLDRVLVSAVHYPGDYGIVPQTLGGDGDPLDVLLLVTYPTFPGALVEAAPVGVLHTIDNGDVDDKIIAVPVHDVRFEKVRNIGDVNKAALDEISNFFATYKLLEGKEVEVAGYGGLNEAQKIIVDAVIAYNDQ